MPLGVRATGAKPRPRIRPDAGSHNSTSWPSLRTSRVSQLVFGWRSSGHYHVRAVVGGQRVRVRIWCPPTMVADVATIALYVGTRVSASPRYHASAGKETTLGNGRPEPVQGRMEDRTIRFWGWLRKATDPRGPGGVEIVHNEAVELVGLWQEDIPDRSLVSATMRHVAACIGGQDGMDSFRAGTSWEERQRTRTAMVPLASAAD